MVNKTILEKYKLSNLLWGKIPVTVYEGEEEQTGLAITATIISAEVVSAEAFLASFELVADPLKGMDSPYGAALLDWGDQEGQAVVVQEWIEGQTLSEMLAESEGLPVNLVLDIAQQVGEHLQSLHQIESIHGGLSLDTILLSSKGTVCVVDAGLAQGLDLGELLASEKVEALPYHAPELRAGGELTARTDFYALGATLYAALTGETLDLDASDLYPSSQCPGLPPELDELVAKCLGADPARRIQSAAELLNGIDEAHRGMQAGAQDTILGMEDSLVGHTLGAYQLVERLGQGGMATVYKAYEPALDRYVAVKILPQFFARDSNFMQRFRREAKAVAQLNHPNIVPIYSYGEEGDITYIAMQYVEGGTLKQPSEQAYELEKTVRLALRIVRALAYAHQRGIVHRDIKPSNVLMAEGDWPMLADFGLAKMAEASQQLTETGVGVGTPMYMSPEQGQGGDVDHRTDIYSMGIMLYEILTGDVPFRADTPMAIVIKHMTAPMPIPREVNPNVPEDLERIILKATAKNPDDRFQTAEELVTALERTQNRLIAGREVDAFPPEELKVAEAEISVPEDVKPVVVSVEVSKSERRIKWGKIVRRVTGMIFILLLIVGAMFWVMQHPEIPKAIIAKVEQILSGQLGATEQTRAFAESILQAINEWEPDYSDDFSDPASGWPVQSNARQETEYKEGIYSVLIKTADTGSDLFMDELRGFDDFVAQVDIRWISSAWNGSAGFLWRFERDKPCYGGWVGPANKRWGLWNRTETIDAGGGSSHIREAQEWNHLTLVVKEENIALYVNDEPIAFISDDECRTGGVQLNVHAGEPGVHVQLDNFKVWDIADLALPDETPAPTLSPADQARAFTEPILAAITDRPPDYEDDFSYPGSGWPIGSTFDGDEWGYEDDAYFISAAIFVEQGSIGAVPDRAPWFSDFVLEVDTRFVSGEWGFWYVIFRDSPGTTEQPTSAHYGVGFYPDGAFTIWKNVGGTHIELLEPGEIALTFKRGFEKTNHLTIVAQGPQLVVYMNGEPFWYAYDESSSGGTISLGEGNETEDIPLRVHFDNIKVWDISGLTLTSQPDALVTAEALNVRAGPGADYDRVGVIREGDELEVVSRTPAGDWLEVIATDDTKGWVSTAYVVLNIALDEIPETTELLTPSVPLGGIVFHDSITGNDEIYVVNIDGSGERRLTDHPAHDWNPTWSPDGMRIVFSSDREAVGENNDQLYVMDFYGSNLTRLTYTERNANAPSWSSDGSRIAFHSWCGLAIINADGSNWVTLMEGYDELCVELPTWSPDSHRIAFRSVTPVGGPPQQHDICVLNDDGSGLLKLATFASEEWGWYVVWSPDGKQVAFDIKQDGQQRYYTVDSDGSGEPQEIAEIPRSWYPNFWPQWSQP